MPVSC